MRNMPEHLIKAIEKAKSAKATKEIAYQSLKCLDLTTLSQDDTPQKIADLCNKAEFQEFHTIPAVCVYPEFIAAAKTALGTLGVNVATVINFPHGDLSTDGTKSDSYSATADTTICDVKEAFEAGASEIDIVDDYKARLKGNHGVADEKLRACENAKKSCAPQPAVKIILESAAYDDYETLNAACRHAIECGADYLKTSTGKHAGGGATMDTAAILMQALKEHADKTGQRVGVKISGGIKTADDCAAYLNLRDQLLDHDWPLRFGASGVYDDLVRVASAQGGPEIKAASAY